MLSLLHFIKSGKVKKHQLMKSSTIRAAVKLSHKELNMTMWKPCYNNKQQKIDLIFNRWTLINTNFTHTGESRNLLSFYLQICVSASAKWPSFVNLSTNLQSFLVFLYLNLLSASLIFLFLSFAYHWGPPAFCLKL